MYKKLEKQIGSMKFAVFIILVFTIEMIIGTFLESYYGTEFANRMMYKTWWFMLTQFFMGLSILFAAFLRLPPRKRLYGFYTIHSGLILLAVGAFVTYYAGIDANITLFPAEPNREVLLPDDVLTISVPDDGTKVSLDLPAAAYKKDLDIEWKEFKFRDFYPYADEEIRWQKTSSQEDALYGNHSSEYLIANENVNQQFILSRHPQAVEFQASTKLGPLQIVYLPNSLANCFNGLKKQAVFLYDLKTQNCYFEGVKDEHEVIRKEMKSGKVLFLYRNKKEKIVTSFLPDLTPYPLDEKLEPQANSSLRSFSTKHFESSPNLLLFGKKAAYFDKDEEAWSSDEMKKAGSKIELPWMGFELTLLKHLDSGFPYKEAVPVMPIQKNNEMVQGGTRAVKFEVRNKIYTVTNMRPVNLLVDGKKVIVEMDKKKLMLPFELVLTKFKMDKDPGTNNPASYESFVSVFTNEGSNDHHVYMNNPLKYSGFTFYQASYAKDRNGNYVSTLAVNIDQGRWIKYLGSILLVFGTMWHFHLNRRRVAKKKVSSDETKDQSEQENTAPEMA